MQRMGASRLPQSQLGRPRGLAPTADGDRCRQLRMKSGERAWVLLLTLLGFSVVSAPACSVDFCQINWTAPRWEPLDTRGHCGVIQLKVGNGPFDAKTVFFFGGHRTLVIRAPLFLIAAAAALGSASLAFGFWAVFCGRRAGDGWAAAPWRGTEAAVHPAHRGTSHRDEGCPELW